MLGGGPRRTPGRDPVASCPRLPLGRKNLLRGRQGRTSPRPPVRTRQRLPVGAERVLGSCKRRPPDRPAMGAAKRRLLDVGHVLGGRTRGTSPCAPVCSRQRLPVECDHVLRRCEGRVPRGHPVGQGERVRMGFPNPQLRRKGGPRPRGQVGPSPRVVMLLSAVHFLVNGRILSYRDVTVICESLSGGAIEAVYMGRPSSIACIYGGEKKRKRTFLKPETACSQELKHGG